MKFTESVPCLLLALLWGLLSGGTAWAQDEDPFGERTQKPTANKTTKPIPQEDPFGDVPDDDKPPAQGNPFGDDPVQQKEAPPTNAQNNSTQLNGALREGEPSQNNAAQNKPATQRPSENQAVATETAFDERFWKYLLANNYKNWAPVAGTNGDFYPGTSPHGDLLKMYLNRAAASNPQTLPNGSVIIKENYGPDRTLLAITVMYRSKGFYPDGGDWYWIKYNPDGTTARGPADQGAQKILGAAQSCIDCHSTAAGGDFTFFND